MKKGHLIAMRITFEVADPGTDGSGWIEDVEPAPVPGDTITHDGRSYVIQPFPLYRQSRSSAPLTGSFKLVKS